ncbi:MAG: class I SAM-dependent methyltransferase [Myxococcota bacterium]|nr:class I SAM-dependent methyltransferase [Myxococcota bacterium]
MSDSSATGKSESQKLLDRAYSLETSDEALSLYRDWARSYDDQLEQELLYVGPAKLAALLAEFLDGRGAEVLDVGCGTGLVAEHLARHGFHRMDGLDFSSEMVAVAREKGMYRELFIADLNQRLALPDESYDAVISCGTFTPGHVGAGALDEILRLIRHGGVLACTIHREVWQRAGFEEKLERLEEQSVIAIDDIRHQPYFEGREPEGMYLLLRRIGALG